MSSKMSISMSKKLVVTAAVGVASLFLAGSPALASPASSSTACSLEGYSHDVLLDLGFELEIEGDDGVALKPNKPGTTVGDCVKQKTADCKNDPAVVDKNACTDPSMQHLYKVLCQIFGSGPDLGSMGSLG